MSDAYETFALNSYVDHIEQQTGNRFHLCPDFAGIREFDGEFYFNVLLTDGRYSESKQAVSLHRLAEYSSRFDRVEPNGVSRAAIILS